MSLEMRESRLLGDRWDLKDEAPAGIELPKAVVKVGSIAASISVEAGVNFMLAGLEDGFEAFRADRVDGEKE